MIIDTGKYLRIDEIEGGEIATLLDEGKEVTSKFTVKIKDEDGNDIEVPKINAEFQIELEDGRKKIMNMNKSSARILAEAWGVETTMWVGKKIKLNKTRQTKDPTKYYILCEPNV